MRSVVFILLTKYYSVDRVKRNEMCGEYGMCGGERGACTVLLRKPEGKRPVGKPRLRWVDNIRLHIQEIGCEIVDLIHLAHERAVMNLRVP
jgi:hypothetical protein